MNTNSTTDTDLFAALSQDARALTGAVDSLWDNPNVHPNVAEEATRLAKTVGTVVSEHNAAAARDLFELLAGQHGLDNADAARARGAAFLASFCITNANLFAA